MGNHWLTGADACNYRNIPKDVEVVFGYLSEAGQPCGWPAEAWTSFSGKHLYRITRLANPLADVFDHEQGTATISQVQAAVDKRLAAYLPSVVYVSMYWWESAFKFLDRPVAWWVADWTGQPHLPVAPWDSSIVAQACQYVSTETYDLSVVSLGFPEK